MVFEFVHYLCSTRTHARTHAACARTVAHTSRETAGLHNCLHIHQKLVDKKTDCLPAMLLVLC